MQLNFIVEEMWLGIPQVNS